MSDPKPAPDFYQQGHYGLGDYLSPGDRSRDPLPGIVRLITQNPQYGRVTKSGTGIPTSKEVREANYGQLTTWEQQLIKAGAKSRGGRPEDRALAMISQAKKSLEAIHAANKTETARQQSLGIKPQEDKKEDVASNKAKTDKEQWLDKAMAVTNTTSELAIVNLLSEFDSKTDDRTSGWLPNDPDLVKGIQHIAQVIGGSK